MQLRKPNTWGVTIVNLEDGPVWVLHLDDDRGALVGIFMGEDGPAASTTPLDKT
jgi:hypothetical protein